MDIVTCGVCGYEYNRSRMSHTCTPESIEMIFLQEIDQPVICNLNSDDLRALRREIIANGSPTSLVKMWEKSAVRKFES